MIKINLLSSKEGKKQRGGKNLVALFVLLVIAEAAGLYVWYDGVAQRAAVEGAKLKDLESKVEELNRVKQKMEEREQNKGTLAKQNIVFEELKYDKVGPSNLLLFLAYALTKKEDNVYNQDEIKAQEDIGWDMSWDPDRLWITELAELDKEAVISGRALSHEDVAELYTRLESSIYFYDVSPDVQEQKFNSELDLKYVEFNLHAKVNYDLEGVPTEVAAAKKK